MIRFEIYTAKQLRDDNNSKENIDILMQVLKVGCATGIVEKDQLPTSLCCLSGMKLWGTALKTNIFHGIQLCLHNMHTICCLSCFVSCLNECFN